MKICPICKGGLTEGAVVHKDCLEDLMKEREELGNELLAASELIRKKNERLESLIGRTSNVLTPAEVAAVRADDIRPYDGVRYRLLKNDRGATSVLANCKNLDALVAAAYHFGVLHPRTLATISAVEVWER